MLVINGLIILKNITITNFLTGISKFKGIDNNTIISKIIETLTKINLMKHGKKKRKVPKYS